MTATPARTSAVARLRARLKLRTRAKAFLHPSAPPPPPARRTRGKGGRTGGKGTPEDGGRPLRQPLPARTTPPGSLALASGAGFFDRYPQFLDTSRTAAQPWRLNLRHEAMISDNRDILDGARVLDIASHDGRWSFAALRSGAVHVTGAEARPELVAHAEANLASLGAAPDSYRFLTGDVYTTLATETVDVDVAMCLGFMYHTFRYDDLFRAIDRCSPRHLIIDTRVEPQSGPLVRVLAESTVNEGSAFSDDASPTGRVLVGWPTIDAVVVMARCYGFRLERLTDWRGYLDDNPDARSIRSYRRGSRATMRFVRSDEAG